MTEPRRLRITPHETIVVRMASVDALEVERDRRRLKAGDAYV